MTLADRKKLALAATPGGRKVTRTTTRDVTIGPVSASTEGNARGEVVDGMGG